MTSQFTRKGGSSTHHRHQASFGCTKLGPLMRLVKQGCPVTVLLLPNELGIICDDGKVKVEGWFS